MNTEERRDMERVLREMGSEECIFDNGDVAIFVRKPSYDTLTVVDLVTPDDSGDPWSFISIDDLEIRRQE